MNKCSKEQKVGKERNNELEGGKEDRKEFKIDIDKKKK